MANKRHSDAAHALSLPKRGFYVLQDPTAGASGKFDAGSILDLRNSLAQAQGLVFAGSAGSAISPTVLAFGTGDFTFIAWIRPRLVGVTQYIFGANPNAAAPGVYLDNVGGLGLFDGATAFQPLPVLSPTLGKFSMVCLRRSNGVLYASINAGAESSIACATNFTQGINRLGNTAATTSPFSGAISRPAIYNRALSTTEIQDVFEGGGPNPGDFNAASNTSIVSGADSDFSGPGSWGLSGASTISGGKLNLSGGDAAFNSLVVLLPGRAVRFTVTVDSLTGSSVSYYNGITYTIFATVPGTYTVDFVVPFGITYVGNVLHLRCSGPTATLDNFFAYKTGVVFSPEATAPGNGRTWNDLSGNGCHVLLPAAPVVEWLAKGAGQSRIRAVTSSNSPQQLLGGTVGDANTQLLRVRARARTGTPTVTLGATSGSAGIVASVALSQSWKLLTIVPGAELSSGAFNLWAGSNSTDIVEWDIAVEPMSF